MSGSTKMYRTKRIIQNDLQIQVPKCMYALKNIYAKDSTEMDAESTNHVSTMNKNSVILNQNNHQIPGMAELEAKQEDILKHLSDLKKQILSIKLDLKKNPDLFKIQTTFVNGSSTRMIGIELLEAKQLDILKQLDDLREEVHSTKLELFKINPNSQPQSTPPCLERIISIEELEAKQLDILKQLDDLKEELHSTKLEFYKINPNSQSQFTPPCLERMISIEELETKQLDILKQLDDLKEDIHSTKLKLKINPNSQPQSTPPCLERIDDLPDLVVNASPTYPPFSLEFLQKLWHDTLELKFTSHLHSSCPTLTENSLKLQDSLTSYIPKPGVPRINIKLIWKNVDVDTQLLVSHVPILGEVNLLRYLVRVVNSPLSYSSQTDSVEIDSILDVCYLILRSKTKTERAGHLVILNKSLGKGQWLGGRSQYSLGDVAAHSAIKQVPSSEINSNLTNWYQRCEAVVY